MLSTITRLGICLALSFNSLICQRHAIRNACFVKIHLYNCSVFVMRMRRRTFSALVLPLLCEYTGASYKFKGSFLRTRGFIITVPSELHILIRIAAGYQANEYESRKSGCDLLNSHWVLHHLRILDSMIRFRKKCCL